jgi:uncharacterized membrane protein
MQTAIQNFKRQVVIDGLVKSNTRITLKASEIGYKTKIKVFNCSAFKAFFKHKTSFSIDHCTIALEFF